MEACRCLIRLVSWITVEPVELFYVLMFTTSNVVRDNLILDKICLLDMKYSPEACYNLTHGNPTEDAIKINVQNKAADLEVIDGILMALPSVKEAPAPGPPDEDEGPPPSRYIPS